MPTLADTCSCPVRIGVALAVTELPSDCCCDNGGGYLNSFMVIDFTPNTFNPNAEAAIFALLFASSIDSGIRMSFTSANFLSEILK
jgi:hypothetical protein